MNRIILSILLGALIFMPRIEAGTRPLFLSASSTLGRTLALGSTFASREDRMQLTGNPACVTSTVGDTAHVVRVQLNPLLPFILMRNLGITGTGDYRVAGETSGALFASLGAGIRGISYEHDWLRVQLGLLEELPMNVLRMGEPEFFSARNIFENHTNSLLVNIRLARSIALGLTTNLYYVKDNHGQQRRGGGICYGILLKPSRKLHIGLAYYNFPDQFPFLREPLERLGDETIHGGLSYHFRDHTRFSLDIRNMTDDMAIAPRELHFGLETTLLKAVCLRGGFYNQVMEMTSVISCGAGLYREAFKYIPVVGHRIDGLDYSFLYETAGKRVWHGFSFTYTL